MCSFRTLIAAAMAAATITFAVAAPAAAGTVTVGYYCYGPGIAQGRIMLMEITAPATATRGSTITLGASITDTRNWDQEFKPGEFHAIMGIALGGASSGTVEATGLDTPAIPRGEPLRLVGGHAQVTLNNVGEVTFSPVMWWHVNNSGVRFYRCEMPPGQTAPVAETTHVA
jgi:hypothetical protein